MCYVVRQAPAVAKTSSFMPALRSADLVVGATGRASLRMPTQTIVMAEAKKSVKDLGPSALKGKKVKAPAPESLSFRPQLHASRGKRGALC